LAATGVENGLSRPYFMYPAQNDSTGAPALAHSTASPSGSPSLSIGSPQQSGSPPADGALVDPGAVLHHQ